jgi:hypothetical protein
MFRSQKPQSVFLTFRDKRLAEEIVNELISGPPFESVELKCSAALSASLIERNFMEKIFSFQEEHHRCLLNFLN